MKKLLLSIFLLNCLLSYGQTLVLHYPLDDLTAATTPANDLNHYWYQGSEAAIVSGGVTGLAGDNCAEFYNGKGYRSTSAISNWGWVGSALSVWYKSSGTYQGTILQGGHLGFGMRINSWGKMHAFFHGTVSGAVYALTSVNDGAWHHLFAQNDGTTTSVYIDGVLEAEGAQLLYTASNPQARIYIGTADGNTTNQSIYGKLDEVKIFNNVLSQAQIDELYQHAPECVVEIPDANFKACLLSNTDLNTNFDGEIQCSEAAAYAGALSCNFHNISNLTGIEALTALTEFTCDANNITSLDVSNNTALTKLSVGNNQISSIDISSNTALTSFSCVNNQITSLDISNNTLLEKLHFSNNQISNIDVSSHPALEVLSCGHNQISSIDVSNNPALYSFLCNNNQITSIDVSNNPALVFNLNVRNNHLTSLNVAHGNNTAFTILNAENNPNLTCIEVDDAAYSTSNWNTGTGAFTFDAASSFSENCAACAVAIPDANFKYYLLADPLINTNGDSEIQCSEAQAFTGAFFCADLSITDLTGIEAFTALTVLSCSTNQLTNIDLSSNTALKSLTCAVNQITNLDLSSNTALTSLHCGYNEITNIDVSNSADLTVLDCISNELTSIDISNNTALTSVYIRGNQLTGLDVSANTALELLNIGSNQISNIDVSNNIALEVLSVSYNQLTNLDVSNNPVVTDIECFGNTLTSLNVANGNNTNFTRLRAENNPGLTCIQVDDPAYSITNWVQFPSFLIDETASYSADCSGPVSISETQVIEVSIFPNPATDVMTVQTSDRVSAVIIYDSFGKKVNTFNTPTFSVSHLSAGIYFISVFTEKGIAQQKFIKQ